MQFQILKIILWPKNQSFDPRTVDIEPGALNIITGSSRTGKSAIIPIIDYCLGSGKCSIPVNTIRDHCSWFGVLVVTESGQKLFARREPGNLRTTGDMYVLEGPEVEVPISIPGPNARVEGVKRALDELAGLTSLDFDVTGDGTGFSGRPSFRDMSAFLFQPQNLVANPIVLFFKADTHEHREKLRTIFPYVLNAVTSQTLAAQHELSSLRRELKRKQNEQNSMQQVSLRWAAEIRARVTEARELNLLQSAVPADSTTDQLISLLELAIRQPLDKVRVTEDTVTESVEELTALRAEESDCTQALLALRKRYSQMSELRASSREYHSALQIQRDRLGIAEWLQSVHVGGHDCPLCGNSFDDEEQVLKQWISVLREVENAAGSIDKIPAAFDREYERVKNEIRAAADRVNGVRTRISSLERTSDAARQKSYELVGVARFVGNVENALALYHSLGDDQDIALGIAALSERILELEVLISEAGVKARTQRAKRAVEANISRLLPGLDAERPNAPVDLVIEDLTIKVVSPNREDYLWEIGSGSNWLSYHVAVSLALQQFFLTLPHSPVPSFLVYDQPSQVWFPTRVSSTEDGEEAERVPLDEDITAVRRVFATINSVVNAANGRLQVIVLDHADSAVWGDLPNVRIVQEWRGANKLIPLEWLS